MEVSPSAYYDWLNRPECERRRQDRRLTEKVVSIHQVNRGICHELLEAGETVSRARVRRLMQAEGLEARNRRQFKATTCSAHARPVAPNRLDRQFDVSQPDTVYAGDITYIPTDEGWLYLAVLIDLSSRAVVGWAMSERMTAQLVDDALKMAIGKRRPAAGLIVHSDRGSQYASARYQATLAEHGFICSTSRKGNCWDNAPAESFFHTLKTELTHHRRYRTREEARQEIFEYIEVFYNRRRRHSTIGYLAPLAYEEKCQAAA